MRSSGMPRDVTTILGLGLGLTGAGCSTVVGLSGAGEDEGGGAEFALISAELDETRQFLTLSFSEAVGPVEGVDPQDFRISFAGYSSLCTDDGCVDQTSYWDPNFFAEYYIGYGPNMGTRFEAALLEPGSLGHQLVLRFEAPLDAAVCEYIQAYGGGDEFLFVHYAAGDIPVTSAEGEGLAPIGPEWVEADTPLPIWEVEGEFPNLDPRISIPCP